MSFGSFYSGLSGLQTNANRLSVIGNNLANLNTVGFKTSRVTFEDIFAQPGSGAGVNGAGNPQQVGLGVQVSGIQQVFSQGQMQTTGLVTDVAIQGKGFYVLQDSNGGQRYSRAGAFTFDKDGNMVNAAGHFLQGYTQVDTNGNIIPSGSLSNVQIPAGLTAPPEPTSVFESALNLDAGASMNPIEPFQTSIAIYDSLGAQHNLTLNFTPVDTSIPADGQLDEWTYEVTLPGDEVVGGTPGTPEVVATGTADFDAQGQLILPAANITIPVPGWTNGAAAQSIEWRMFDNQGDPLLTGFSAPSSVSSSSQNGFSVGALRVLTINQDGLISGVFTNGRTLELGRLALATFNNGNGLLKAGQNTFIDTNSSGAATIGAANEGGRGIVRSNSLELSNVDITQEFTDLIVSERGYQANSRIITTTDSVIQEALNLKR